MGLTLPYSASTPAVYRQKQQECIRAGKYLRTLLERDIKPLDIMTRPAFLNAIVITMVLCGSTNAVLHLLAVARACDVPLDISDFEKIAATTPVLGNLQPSGKYMMEDLHKIGGLPAVMKYLIEQGMIDGNCMTVTGETIAENVSSAPSLDFDAQDIVWPIAKPIKPTGHIRIFTGNFCPGGAVGKITGKEGLRFRGKAMCFNDEQSAMDAIRDHKLVKGTVVILRYKGPRGGPGCPEQLKLSGAIMGEFVFFVSFLACQSNVHR